MAGLGHAKSYLCKTEAVTDEIIDRLSKQLSCSICLEEYSRPRVLPCLHVFCEGCAEILMRKQHDKIKASYPNCCKSVSLHEGSASSLPSAFYIQHLFDVREALVKVHNPKKAQCDKCGEGEVQNFCRDCGQFICQLCLVMHHKWKELQNHEISTLDQVQKTASQLMTPKRVTTLCTSHPTEPVKIYCETCDELMCYECAIKTHRDHNYDPIPDIFPKHRDHLLACLEPLKSELSSVIATINKLKLRSSKLDEQGVRAKEKVDAEVAKLQAILEGHRRDLYSKIDDKVQQGKQELATKIEQHGLRQSHLRSCVEFVEGSIQSGTQEEVLSMKKLVVHRTQQMTDEFKPCKLQLDQEKHLRVECTDLSSLLQKIGEVSFTVDFEGRHFLNIDGLNHPTQVAFASTGDMVVCEWNGNCVSVFDSNRLQLRSFGNNSDSDQKSRLDEPLGVALSSDNTVFVASCHCVKKYTLEGEFLASVGSEGSGELQFHTPFAIAYNTTNNRVYVCDTVNNRITMLNHDLTFHDNFGSKGRDSGQFNMPEGISINKKGNILVADHLNNRIQVFTSDGSYISSITHTKPGEKLQGPISVAVGCNDWVYVVENYSERVSVFNESGKYVKSFGSKGDRDGEFNDPYAIAVSDDGCVYVSDTNNDRIQIFK